MKKRVKIVVGLAAALIAGIGIVGSLLPERYDATVETRMSQPPERVWAAIADFEKNPVAGEMRRATVRAGDGAWVEDLGSTKLTVRTVEAREPEFVKRTVSDASMPMTQEIEARLSAEGTGTVVRARHVTVIRAGTFHVPLFRIVMGPLGGAKKGAEGYWRGVEESMGGR